MATVHPAVSDARATPVRTSYVAEDLGKLLLRLAVGILVLMHGIAKIGSGPGTIAGTLERNGLPGELAYAVYIGEVLAPLLLIIGLWTRAAAVLVVINMLFAIGLVHLGDLVRITNTGGWALELQAMFLVGALAIALLGAGRFSAGGIGGRLN
jgi:putative oxidoreductase